MPRYTEKESELVAIMYRYLLEKHDKVRLEVGDIDIVGYGPKHQTTAYEVKIKDWKALFQQMRFAQLFCDDVYGVMPTNYVHLALRNWDLAPVGCGLYEITVKGKVYQIYPSLPLKLLSPMENSRFIYSAITCLGREPYR
jgi:hypothetical protein